MADAFAFVCFVLGLIPALLYCRNLFLYAPPPKAGKTQSRVSVLVPARDEERNIRACLESILANKDVDLEVIVLDDHSSDRTGEIVREIAGRDQKVRLESAPELPAGWCGKQHACAALSRFATAPLMLFVDADVRLRPDGIGRIAAFMDSSGADLASGVPEQKAGTLAEKLIIPFIHTVLLGFLPIGWARRSGRAPFAAGCGQLMMARAAAYRECGGHAAIRASLHDGVTLPRLFRSAGFKTDLFDATPVASCRMFRSSAELWRGLSRNAHEGLGAPGLIGPVTVLLLLGQVGPFVMVPFSPVWAGMGIVAALLPRIAGAWRFRQSVLGVLLHPVGVLGLLAIQWTGFARAMQKKPARWRGRAIPASLAILCMAANGFGAMESFELADQYNQIHSWKFPKQKATMLVIADRLGSKQLPAWIAPIHDKFGTQIDIYGIADLSAVPGFLRNTIRKQFVRDLAYPVMLDWEGSVARSFGPTANKANVYLIDRSGKIRIHLEDNAATDRLGALAAAIETVIAE